MADLLARAASAGLWLRLDGATVRWRSLLPPSAALLNELCASKQAVINALTAEAIGWRDFLSECAAILEYDAGMPRAAAEAAAFAEAFDRWTVEHPHAKAAEFAAVLACAPSDPRGE